MEHRVVPVKRGMSLVEVVVATFVLCLVVTVALQIFLPSLGQFHAADAAFDVQRQALLSAGRLSQDLSETRRDGARYEDGRLILASPRDGADAFVVDADGARAWTSHVVWWTVPDDNLPGTSILMRARFLGPTPPTTGQMMARGVVDFSFSTRSGSDGAFFATVKIGTVRDWQSRRSTFWTEKTVEIPY